MSAREYRFSARYVNEDTGVRPTCIYTAVRLQNGVGSVIMTERTSKVSVIRHMSIAFFDIDGTLAVGTEVPESAGASVVRLRSGGHLVFLCTGRSREYVERHFGGIADGFICYNGRFAFMGDRVLFDEPLSPEQIASLRETLRNVEADSVFFGAYGAFFGRNPCHYEAVASEYEGGYVQRELSSDSGPVYNFDVLFCNAAHYARIRDALKNTCLLNPHGPHPSADATVSGVDKGDALRVVADRLHISLEDTYAFGDGINDISMLKAAGHGVAMGNAVDELKNAAEYVTTGILEDGVKNALLHYGLI